jgi:hypothetical protein
MTSRAAVPAASRKKPGRPPGSGGVYAVAVRVFEGDVSLLVAGEGGPEPALPQRLVVAQGVSGLPKLQEEIAKAFFPNGQGGSLVAAGELELFRKTHGEGLFLMDPEHIGDARVTNVFPNGSTMVCCARLRNGASVASLVARSVKNTVKSHKEPWAVGAENDDEEGDEDDSLQDLPPQPAGKRNKLALQEEKARSRDDKLHKNDLFKMVSKVLPLNGAVALQDLLVEVPQLAAFGYHGAREQLASNALLRVDGSTGVDMVSLLFMTSSSSIAGFAAKADYDKLIRQALASNEVARIADDNERRKATSESLKKSLGSDYEKRVFKVAYAEVLAGAPKHAPKSPIKSRKEQSSEEEEEEDDEDVPPPSKRPWKKAAETEFAHKSKKHQTH